MPGGIVSPQSTILGSSYSSSSFSAAKVVHLLVLFVALVQRGVGGMVQGGGVTEDQVFLRGLDYWGRQNMVGAVCGLLFAGCGSGGCGSTVSPPPILSHKNNPPPRPCPTPIDGAVITQKIFCSRVC